MTTTLPNPLTEPGEIQGFHYAALANAGVTVLLRRLENPLFTPDRCREIDPDFALIELFYVATRPREERVTLIRMPADERDNLTLEFTVSLPDGVIEEYGRRLIANVTTPAQ